jgi:cytochrome oxidase assembly protein ShyY1
MLQPRYAALSALMVLVAAVCIAAGTWQIARLAYKIDTNGALRHNAHTSVEPVAAILPVVGAGTTPARDRIQYRRVVASGTYDAAGQTLVRQQQVNGDTGYEVLTPLETDAGPTLLVVRGFISDSLFRGALAHAGAPPLGHVDVTARVEPGDQRADKFAELRNGQVESVDPADQSARLRSKVYDGYVELLAGQAGTSGLVAMPESDLSNPAGGAVEPQHLAYVLQWYLFAALALAAPVAMARAEVKRAPGQIDDADAPGEKPAAESAAESAAARLADRYGRPVR